jgi:hypothetical protein
MSLPQNAPDKPGIYWAKSGTYQWWNLLVLVFGESPYLRMEIVWDRGYSNVGVDDIVEFGAEVPDPTGEEESE